MTRLPSISTSISRSVSLLMLLLLAVSGSHAQGFLKLERDSVPLFRGFAVSFDALGAVQMQLGDYGQYEGALRLNLHDQYFPTLEVGLGRANHEEDEVTGIAYKTSAPYFRLGCDFNLSKNKHSNYRVLAGLRYAFTSYKVDIMSRTVEDPVWHWDTSFGVTGERCSQHWAEVVFGIDATIFGPLHMGWSVRYKLRLAHNDGQTEKTWYVPGYGTWGDTKLWGTYNITIDI